MCLNFPVSIDLATFRAFSHECRLLSQYCIGSVLYGCYVGCKVAQFYDDISLLSYQFSVVDYAHICLILCLFVN